MLAINQVLTVALESTEGTDATPAGTDAIECAELSPGYDFQKLERIAVKNSISALKTVIGQQTMSLSIVCELKGSSAAGTAPKIGRLIQCCYYAETVSSGVSVAYAPLSPSSTPKTCTIYLYKDGMLWKSTACRGNLKIDLTAGAYPTITFTMSGKFAGVSDTAVATPTYESTLPVIVESAGMSFGTFNAAVVSNVTFDSGNTISVRKNVNAAQGIQGYKMDSRNPVYTAKVEAVLEATKAYWGGQQARTEEAIDFTHGTVEGNIVELAISKACTEKITVTKDGNTMIWDISGQALENAGNDNVTITFK